MDFETIKCSILHDFSLIPVTIPGIFLYGSLPEGRFDERSDIDICLVAGRENSPVRLQSQVWQYLSSGRYDVRIFELLPLYMQIRILARGILLVSPDPAALGEYLYPYWKRWDDQRWYQTPIPGAP